MPPAEMSSYSILKLQAARRRSRGAGELRRPLDPGLVGAVGEHSDLTLRLRANGLGRRGTASVGRISSQYTSRPSNWISLSPMAPEAIWFAVIGDFHDP